MHDAVDFLMYVLKDADSRPLFRKKVRDARAHKTLSTLQKQQVMSDYILIISCSDKDLISKLVTPIEIMFDYAIPSDKFVKLLLDYRVLSEIQEIKAFDVTSDSAQKHFRSFFFIDTKSINLDISYRKWQIDWMLADL